MLSTQSLCIFCDESEHFLGWCELRIRLDNDVFGSDTPFVRPLLDTLDKHERYGVILTDRVRARLSIVFLGEIEEHTGMFATGDAQRVKAIRDRRSGPQERRRSRGLIG